MSFSDEDLKLWKKQFEKHHDEQGLALLARLEAAEAVIELSNCKHSWDEHENKPCDQAAVYLRWLASKRSPGGEK